jgi:hypothetical protein
MVTRRWARILPAPDDLRAVKTGERGEVYRLVTYGQHEGQWRSERGVYAEWGSLREVDLIEVTEPAPCARCWEPNAAFCECVCDCESYEPCHGECCGFGNCTCSMPPEQVL